MSPWVGVLLFVAGGLIGALVMALCAAAGRADEWMERENARNS